MSFSLLPYYLPPSLVINNFLSTIARRKKRSRRRYQTIRSGTPPSKYLFFFFFLFSCRSSLILLATYRSNKCIKSMRGGETRGSGPSCSWSAENDSNFGSVARGNGKVCYPFYLYLFFFIFYFLFFPNLSSSVIFSFLFFNYLLPYLLDKAPISKRQKRSWAEKYNKS